MSKEIKQQYAYSFDGERYYGRFETREEAEAEAFKEAESEGHEIAFIGEILTAEEIIQTDRVVLGWRISNRLVEFLEEELFEIISADSEIIEFSEEEGRKAEEKILDAILEHWTFRHYTIKEGTVEEIKLQKEVAL